MNTSEKLKKILYEWKESTINGIYQRSFDMKYLDGSEILTIVGARRTGKTYLCFQIIQQLKKAVPADNILYVNFEDERLYPLNGDELTLLLDVYFETFLVDTTKRIYLFIDEIQNVPLWSKWARRITEQNKNLKLIITGSSSKLLSKEIATELRGRNLSFNVFPLSFVEYLVAKQLTFDYKDILYRKERNLIKRYFNDYFKTGGFPAIFTSAKPQELLHEYYDVMFYRDIVERHVVTNVKMLEDYLSLLIDQTACKFSVSQTAAKLQEFGYSFSKNTLMNFLNYAEEAYLVFPVNKYSFKIREQMRAPKKLYAIDHGLVNAIRFMFSENYGRMMENIVYLALRRTTENIYYYQGIKECDFLVTNAGKITTAIQVTKNLSTQQIRKREIEGLLEALAFAKLKQGIIITENEYETIKEGVYTICVLPLWYWLLNNFEILKN